MHLLSNKKLLFIFILILSLKATSTHSKENVLKADGSSKTYELISSVLAPGFDAVENPDSTHKDFGRHITQIFDKELNEYVFEFHSHVDKDDDRGIKFDRQRIEIKTYDNSPDELKGVPGETVTYKWKFKLPEGFQPSTGFTHIFQIKAVGGEDSAPIFTLTPRKGDINKMELIHNNKDKLVRVDLDPFIGRWVEVTQKMGVGQNEPYSIIIQDIKTKKTLLEYSSNSLQTIRPSNKFIRPKWGIYRSLKNKEHLRDEKVRFNEFVIIETKK